MIKMHDRIDEKRSCMHLVRFHTVWSVAKQKKTSTEYLNPYLIPNNKETKFFSIYFFLSGHPLANFVNMENRL
jgi:hypothetical protein